MSALSPGPPAASLCCRERAAAGGGHRSLSLPPAGKNTVQRILRCTPGNRKDTALHWHAAARVRGGAVRSAQLPCPCPAVNPCRPLPAVSNTLWPCCARAVPAVQDAAQYVLGLLLSNMLEDPGLTEQVSRHALCSWRAPCLASLAWKSQPS